jgi:ApaG protein
MQDVSRTLVKVLLREVGNCPRRLRPPVMFKYWGQGGKIPRRNAADRILSAFPTLRNLTGLEQSTIFEKHIQPYLTSDEDSSDDSILLRNVLCSVIRERNKPKDVNELNIWLSHGFEFSRALHQVQDLMLGSSITKTNGLYVDVTSTFHPALSAATPNNDHMFAYSLYIENQSDKTLQILGRQWKYFSHENPQSIEEVKQLEKGIVGHQPKLEPGEAFYYVSGTKLDSFSGEMSGYLLVREYGNHEEEERSSCGVHVPGEKTFLADVGPFQLLAPEPA